MFPNISKLFKFRHTDDEVARNEALLNPPKSYPSMESFEQWRNEMLLSGAWVSLMLQEKEVSPRQHIVVTLRDDGMVSLIFSGGKPIVWENITCSADGMGIWLWPQGGRYLHTSFSQVSSSAGGNFNVTNVQLDIRD